jgi:hypothetical protein
MLPTTTITIMKTLSTTSDLPIDLIRCPTDLVKLIKSYSIPNARVAHHDDQISIPQVPNASIEVFRRDFHSFRDSHSPDSTKSKLISLLQKAKEYKSLSRNQVLQMWGLVKNGASSIALKLELKRHFEEYLEHLGPLDQATELELKLVARESMPWFGRDSGCVMDDACVGCEKVEEVLESAWSGEVGQ